MRTRKEHIEALRQAAAAARSEFVKAYNAIDYAIENGMPVAPELVEPVVGQVLTETTRLVDNMIVHLPKYRACAIYNAPEGRWEVSKVSQPCLTEDMGTTWRIAFVPDEKTGGGSFESRHLRCIPSSNW